MPVTPADTPDSRVTDVDVCVIGSANLDLVVTTHRHPAPGETVLGSTYAEHAGGKGLNQAVAAARSGARTAMVTALGVDTAGDELRSVLVAEAIDDSLVDRVEAPTGRAVIVVDEHGENSIVVVPGANATVACPASLPPAAVVLAQLEVPVEAVATAFAAARRAGAITVLNPAPATDLPASLCADCDVIVPNQHELELLGGAGHLLRLGAGAVVVTRGSEGADVHSGDELTHVESFQVDVVDTTGAGDAFCGSLCARLASGDALLDAVRWACAAGALATTVAGAVPAQPRAEAIRRLLDT